MDVTLVDRKNHHLFQPLLYQVATAGLSPAEIAYPIRRILRRQQNARVLLADATSIDPAARLLRLVDGEIPYDWLLLAAGAGHSYFGRDEWNDLGGIERRRRLPLLRSNLLGCHQPATRLVAPRWSGQPIAAEDPRPVAMLSHGRDEAPS